MHPIFFKKDTYIKHFNKICSANYEDNFFYSLAHQILCLVIREVTSLINKLLVKIYYTYCLNCPHLKKLFCMPPVYNNAVTTEAFINLTVYLMT